MSLEVKIVEMVFEGRVESLKVEIVMVREVMRRIQKMGLVMVVIVEVIVRIFILLKFLVQGKRHNRLFQLIQIEIKIVIE